MANKKGRPAVPAAQRFFNKVFKENGTLDPSQCWFYGSIGGTGYGIIGIGGKSYYAHRYSYELHTGKTIPKHAVISHECNNRACVNPRHIELSTQKQNIEYMIACGRQKPYSERKPKQLMTPEEKMACVMFRLSGKSYYFIAKKYGRGLQHVKSVVETYLKKHSNELIGTLHDAQKELYKEAA